MKYFIIFALVTVAFCQDVPEVSKNETESSRKERVFSFLQVMKFPNDVCLGSNGRNGTCYSSDECTNKVGTASGTCANGFGVCCIFSIGCGQTSSENNTYLVLGATTTPSPNVCTYTLCENNPNICRIRLDFTTFAINGPTAGTVRANADALNVIITGTAIGDCTSDTFTLSAPGNRAAPVICGTNTGQHMYIDTTSGSCAKATFDFGSTATSRQYDIKVTQYNCGDEMAGPSDCLQYHTTDTGITKSFNFNLAAGGAAAASDATHLSNQLYNICFRRNSGKCAICFTPSVTNAAATSATTQNSFGLSISTVAASKSGVETDCSTDYLIIPNGLDVATVKNAGPAVTIGKNRFCGRMLNVVRNLDTIVSVCTGLRPFRITFNTDANEVQGIDAAGAMANTNEDTGFPSGTLGFSLDYVQQSC